MKRLKGAAMGAGYFSRFQYEAWTRIPEVEMAAIYNRTENKARATMVQYAVPRYYANWREMIDAERPDFVDIITPPETHEEMCAYAASRGVHIICQKPLAPDFGTSRRIVETARAAGVREGALGALGGRTCPAAIQFIYIETCLLFRLEF